MTSPKGSRRCVRFATNATVPVDETYVKVAGRWRYVYRAIDQFGQVVDVYVSPRRDTRAARRFFVTALGDHGAPTEVVTDRACTLLAVVDEVIPTAFHNTARYANNRIEADHGRLKARLRPMRGLQCDRSARVIIRGHAFMQNLRRGHYEFAVEARSHRRVSSAFVELAGTVALSRRTALRTTAKRQTGDSCGPESTVSFDSHT
jgi:transposase, IS6 family